MHLVPISIRGELYVGGEGVARGYLNRQELTAERFVPNPYGKIPGERLYRSGDHASWRRDRSLDYFGRLDHQVKVRGFRVELGEIEAALRESCGVKQATVVFRTVGGGEARLVAYVVPASDVAASNGSSIRYTEQLRETLKQRLPEYMVPSAFVLLHEIPLTPNGKIDHKALPEPDLNDNGREDSSRARSPEEEALCEIFSEVLKRERIGIEQNFFDSGGHSLIAAQAIARVRTVLGVELPLRALFEEPTVAGLAKRLARVRREGTGVVIPPLVKYARYGAEQLSFAQERLWFLDQLVRNNPFYNMPAALLIQGKLNLGALAGSLREVVRRHEALRTTFSN
ncbi:MAG TPA: phosphopantetheine-binding protein, partial [Candidatus Sulfotelmatobacter sp.]|nr:phosphopantetheine-binding protein [Candidatus Sulfotelmatobacter sp.]